MKVAVLKEIKSGEKRVAASPETVKRMLSLGVEVVLESGAGEGSCISDEEYKAVGGVIAKNASETLKGADVILKVQPPFEGAKSAEYSSFPKGSVLISQLDPFSNKKNIGNLAEQQITSFALEFVPRITRAQAMDVLSSQSNLAGYKAVIEGVSRLSKVVPMMTTAAGTIKPAKVLVLGAGVAGLQAIATAKRLGAIVSAFDVRPDVKEQVESLGATFIEVESTDSEDAETKGGYAKEMSEEYKRKQAVLIADTVKDQDIVITTALIPGRSAPRLVDEDMLKNMRDGSVVVDLAAVAGGNCEFAVCGKIIEKYGVSIIGYDDLPSRVAKDASLLYAKNILSFITQIIDKETKDLKIDFEDEIIVGSLITHNGKVVHERLSDSDIKAGEKKEQSSEPMPKKVAEQKPSLKKEEDEKKPSKRKEGAKV